MTVLITVFSFYVITIFAQTKVYDVVTLKDGRGVLKGFINEQVLGKRITITPCEAIVKIDISDIKGEMPTKSIVKRDSDTVELDVITLSSTNECIEGSIIAEYPGKWYKMSTKNLSPQTYAYDEVEKIGRSVVDENDDIFDEYGVLDVIELMDGKQFRGIIVEQFFGEYLTIKDVNDKKNKIVDFKDVKLTRREACMPSVDAFKQSDFLDVVHTNKGGLVRGIIICQIPGESVTVEFPSNGGNSDPILYTDIEKISREVNPYKEKIDFTSQFAGSEEPDSVGLFYYKENAVYKQMNAYEFQRTKKNKYIKLLNAQPNANDAFKVNKECELTVKIDGNIDDVMTSIKVWSVLNNVDRQTKVIPMQITSSDVEDYFYNNQSKMNVKAERFGKSSIKVVIRPQVAGEYAITYRGCERIPTFIVE